MQTQHVPLINSRYWIALILASIFGANTGDFFSDVLGLGHINGLPFLLLLFAIILICERFDRVQHEAYYWAAIIVVRTSATNMGDIFHDVNVSFLISIPCLSAALFSVLLYWKFSAAKNLSASAKDLPDIIQTNWIYWVAMLLAGTLGTVIGDYFSYPLKLGNLNATFVLGAVLALTFIFGYKDKLRMLFYFWFTVVIIRAAGTAAGDYFANHVFGLSLSVVITGSVFISCLFFWKK